jgi:hypothetical protein
MAPKVGLSDVTSPMSHVDPLAVALGPLANRYVIARAWCKASNYAHQVTGLVHILAILVDKVGFEQAVKRLADPK